eukprot:4934098-Heterocapsa_arctica.AAC.1
MLAQTCNTTAQATVDNSGKRPHLLPTRIPNTAAMSDMTMEDMRALLTQHSIDIGKNVVADVTSSIMSQVTLLLETKLKLAEDRLMESIRLLTTRTALLETRMNSADDDEISDMGGDSNSPAPKRRMTEGRRKAPQSSASAPSGASTRAPEANPAIIWMFGFPHEMINAKLKKFAKAAIEENMTGWATRIVMKATSLDHKCSIQFESDFGAH